MKRHKTVDEFIAQAGPYQQEIVRLREILLDTALTEEVKWGAPCYTFAGKNVVGIGSFQSYFGLWFHQGALLDDCHDVLVNAQEGVTKALRQWRMTRVQDIKPRVIRNYVKQAIELVKAGREIKPERNKSVELPQELTSALNRNRKTMSAFQKLSPGKQRDYAEYIRSARQESTKASRIRKILPMIDSGVGLNDRYRGG